MRLGRVRLIVHLHQIGVDTSDNPTMIRQRALVYIERYQKRFVPLFLLTAKAHLFRTDKATSN
jgi:hypothetical protein